MADDDKQPLRAADAYEAKYMSASALYRDKIKAPLAYHLILALPLLTVLAVSIFAAHAPLFLPLFEVPFLFLVWALFSVLRITVTKDELVVQYGVFGPRVAIASITKVEAVDYDWKEYGGWGIRRGSDGTMAYNMLGDKGRAVRVEYSEGGKAKKLLLASPNPVALAQAIQNARGGVRVAAPVQSLDKRVEAEPIADEFEAEDEATEQKATR